MCIRDSMKANERANTSDAAFFRNSGFFIIITIPFCTLSDKVRCVKREGVHGAGAPVGQHEDVYKRQVRGADLLKLSYDQKTVVV